MKRLLPVLLGLLIPYQLPSANEDSPLTVVNFKWSRARRTFETAAEEGNAPARAMIPQNRNFARVEYADGSVSQRKTWNMAEVQVSYERALREPWAPGMCKGL